MNKLKFRFSEVASGKQNNTQFAISNIQSATMFDIVRRQLTKLISAPHQTVVSSSPLSKGLVLCFLSSLTSQNQGQTNLPYLNRSSGFKSNLLLIKQHQPQGSIQFQYAHSIPVLHRLDWFFVFLIL